VEEAGDVATCVDVALDALEVGVAKVLPRAESGCSGIGVCIDSGWGDLMEPRADNSVGAG
jgi:hypothetical protein